MLVRHDGTVVEGDRPLNQAAFAIHSQVHAARPDVISAAHSHSVYGKTWSTLAGLLDPITQDACAFYDAMRCSTSTPASCSTSRASASPVGDRKAVILRNHGLLTTVGHSVEEAAWWFIHDGAVLPGPAVGRGRGTPVLIEPAMAKHTAGQVGTHFAGWFSFQPLFARITREQPDLFE